jgi:hypothetical protein
MFKFQAKEKFKLITFKSLDYLEKYYVKEQELRYSPTFIVGPPRSGSTLTMQLITWSIPTSYFSNMMTAAWRTLGYPLPFTIAKIGKWLRVLQKSPIYQSHEGNIKGPSHSTEGTYVWEYWFGTKRAPYEPNDLSADQIKQIYQAVAATERTFNLPFVNKTINLSLRIRALAKIFPSALFLQIMRNPIDIAQSIYKIRSGKPDFGYFGARPKECKTESGKNLIEQVCEQVYYIEKSIAFERAAVGESRFKTVFYKNICENPLGELQKIADHMCAHGAPAEVTRSVPAFFKYSTGRKIGEKEYHTMCNLLAELYSKDANLDKNI